MRTRALPYYEFSEGLFEIDEFDCASVFVIVGEERALVLDGSFSKIVDIVSHKASLNRYKKIEIMPCILSNH